MLARARPKQSDFPTSDIFGMCGYTWSHSQKLGEGSYGKVYLGWSKVGRFTCLGNTLHLYVLLRIIKGTIFTTIVVWGLIDKQLRSAEVFLNPTSSVLVRWISSIRGPLNYWSYNPQRSLRVLLPPQI